MGLYQCDKCGCIENTALGFFHTRSITNLWPEEFINKQLCSACGPRQFKNGEPTDYGEWHGKFQQTFYPVGSLKTNGQGNVVCKCCSIHPSSCELLVTVRPEVTRK